MLYSNQNIIFTLTSSHLTSSIIIYLAEDKVKPGFAAEMNGASSLKLLPSNLLKKEKEGEENGRKKEVMMTDIMSTIMTIGGILDEEPRRRRRDKMMRTATGF